jgi:hypothetical protein
MTAAYPDIDAQRYFHWRLLFGVQCKIMLSANFESYEFLSKKRLDMTKS